MAGGEADEEGVPNGEVVSASTRSSDRKFGVEEADEEAAEEAAAAAGDGEVDGGDDSCCVAFASARPVVNVVAEVAAAKCAGCTAVIPFLKPLTPKNDTSMFSFVPEDRRKVSTRNRPYTGRAKRWRYE